MVTLYFEVWDYRIGTHVTPPLKRAVLDMLSEPEPGHKSMLLGGVLGYNLRMWWSIWVI